MSTHWRIALRVAVIAAIGVGIWLMLRGLDTDALGRALARAKLHWLALAAAINFGILLCKAASWWIMLAPEYPVRLRRLFRLTISAFAASVLVPARAGEVMRIVVLRRQDGVPAARSTSVALAEKLFDAIAMLIVVAPVPWLVPDLPGHAGWWLAAIATGSLAALVILRILIDRVHPDGWLGRFLAGLAVLRSPRKLAAVLGVLVASWLIDLGLVWAVLAAVGIELPLAAGLVILFCLNLTVALPSTPGGIGALELGALFALDMLHVPREPALAFALLYHAVQVIPLVAVALVLDARLLFGRWPTTPAE
jgi:uncharacterized membrane protein YbhN (UPF0104 family)